MYWLRGIFFPVGKIKGNKIYLYYDWSNRIAQIMIKIHFQEEKYFIQNKKYYYTIFERNFSLEKDGLVEFSAETN